jgi:hypothetical protein
VQLARSVFLDDERKLRFLASGALRTSGRFRGFLEIAFSAVFR